MSLYARILRYLRPHAGIFGVSVAGMVVYAALDTFSFTLLIPFLYVLFGMQGGAAGGAFGAGGPTGGGAMHRLLDWAVGDLVTGAPPMAALRNVVLLLFAVFMVKNVALYVEQYTISMTEGLVMRDMRRQIYARLLQLGFPFFQRTRTGQIISRVTVDIEQMRSLVTRNLAQFASNLLQAVFFFAAMLLISWKMTLVAVLCVPLMLVLWQGFRHRLRRGVLKALNAGGEVSSHLQETVSGIRLVKASGAEAWENRRFAALTQGQYKAQLRNDRWRQFFGPATEMITASAILGLLWYGSSLVLRDHALGAGEFLTLLVLAGKLMAPVKWLGNFGATVQPGLAAAERAFELLDAPVEVYDQPGARPAPTFRDALRFEDVTFRYSDGEPVLRNVSLEVRPGKMVALVGPSGAGKSTLADLIPRFHDPTAGRITLDGVALGELKLGDLRGLLGIVTQETILFHDTVRANIAYGREGVPQERVEAAARAANAHGFIAEMPEGYDTVLGEKGVRLSGGQRQRIAIARALLRNPPILILDEATSALDNESERLVQMAIDELVHDRTVVVIAHRLSTVRRADLILVMEGGRIVQRGSHDELLAEGGLYRRLYDMQFTEPPPSAPGAGGSAGSAEASEDADLILAAGPVPAAD
ncbi:MAG: transporter transrane region [Gemmatimonadetes bacterium]|nr:transporter transrane region [Gemmatimonadota bacterium]